MSPRNPVEREEDTDRKIIAVSTMSIGVSVVASRLRKRGSVWVQWREWMGVSTGSGGRG